MTLNKIIKSIKMHPEFLNFDAVKKMLVRQDIRDLLVGFSFERTGDSLYIWKYIDPLIFNNDFKSFLFSDRLNIPGSLAFNEFNLEKTLPVLIKESKDFPNNIKDLVQISDAKSGLSFEQVEQLLIMKIYLSSKSGIIDSELDSRLLSHVSSVEIKYDYQKKRVDDAKYIVNKSLNERQEYFNDIIERRIFKIK